MVGHLGLKDTFLWCLMIHFRIDSNCCTVVDRLIKLDAWLFVICDRFEVDVDNVDWDRDEAVEEVLDINETLSMPFSRLITHNAWALVD